MTCLKLIVELQTFSICVLQTCIVATSRWTNFLMYGMDYLHQSVLIRCYLIWCGAQYSYDFIGRYAALYSQVPLTGKR